MPPDTVRLAVEVIVITVIMRPVTIPVVTVVTIPCSLRLKPPVLSSSLSITLHVPLTLGHTAVIPLPSSC